MSAEELRTLVSKHYEIGEIKRLRRIEGGYVNTSYELVSILGSVERRFFLREYKEGIKEEEVQFEHSIIRHLMKRGFSITARIIPTKDGKTYISRGKGLKNQKSEERVFVSLFDFLSGENRYAWDNPACSEAELRSAATVLARYHDAVFDLKHEGRREEPRIIDLLPGIAEMVENSGKWAGTTVFGTYLLSHADSILGTIARIQASIDRSRYDSMIHLAIHCDYHPGNLKFGDKKVTSLFDFDGSKIDARSFDVALAIAYFCSVWEGPESGTLRVDKTMAFLEAYQEALNDGAGIGPMDGRELQILQSLIEAGNLYILRWDLEDFRAADPDPQEYLRYLKHHVLVMKWLGEKSNRHRLRTAIRTSAA
jgi:homoserine kinase type II